MVVTTNIWTLYTHIFSYEKTNATNIFIVLVLSCVQIISTFIDKNLSLVLEWITYVFIVSRLRSWNTCRVYSDSYTARHLPTGTSNQRQKSTVRKIDDRGGKNTGLSYSQPIVAYNIDVAYLMSVKSVKNEAPESALLLVT